MEGKPCTIDLHVHTNRSDGRHSAAGLLAAMESAGVKTAAVADHDTLWGARDAGLAADAYEIKILPAMEISTSFAVAGVHVEEVHLLWYGMDTEAGGVRDFEKRIYGLQNERADLMVQRLCRKGYDLDFEPMVNAESPAPVAVPPIVMQMIERGYLAPSLDAVREFILAYLGPGGEVYEPPHISLEDALESVNSLGGISVIAHPAKIADPRALELMLRSAGGIEACYGAHSPEETERYRTIAKERGLFITCGSDFHGYYEDAYRAPEIPADALGELERFLDAASGSVS